MVAGLLIWGTGRRVLVNCAPSLPSATLSRAPKELKLKLVDGLAFAMTPRRRPRSVGGHAVTAHNCSGAASRALRTRSKGATWTRSPWCSRTRAPSAGSPTPGTSLSHPSLGFVLYWLAWWGSGVEGRQAWPAMDYRPPPPAPCHDLSCIRTRAAETLACRAVTTARESAQARRSSPAAAGAPWHRNSYRLHRARSGWGILSGPSVCRAGKPRTGRRKMQLGELHAAAAFGLFDTPTRVSNPAHSDQAVPTRG